MVIVARRVVRNLRSPVINNVAFQQFALSSLSDYLQIIVARNLRESSAPLSRKFEAAGRMWQSFGVFEESILWLARPTLLRSFAEL